MADEILGVPGEQVASSLSNYGRGARSLGSNQLYSCLDLTVHQDPRKTISKDDLMVIARDCRANIAEGRFTDFTYGLAYSPEFVKQVNDAIKLRIEKLQEEEEALESARRSVELREKTSKKAKEDLEKLKQEVKAAGLEKEVM